MALSFVSWVLLVATGLGWSVSLWELAQLWRVRRRAVVEPRRWPSFSVLKPLAGLDDELVENLESHLKIDYPGPWELLLGVRSTSDAAWPFAKAFVDANPGRARLFLQQGSPGQNPKVNQLITLAEHATGEVIALTDSNIRIKPSLLREHACRLAEPKVVLTSQIFAGVGEQSLGAAFDNMTINGFAAPALATCETTFGLVHLVGKSMAVKREALEQLGGWAALKDLLAEDQQLGRLLEAAGHHTRLCPTPVENVQTGAGLGHFWSRQSRWAMIRFRVEAGAWFEPLLNLTLWPLLFSLLEPGSPLRWGVFAAGAVFSILYTEACTRLMRGHGIALKWLALVPMRDLLFMLVWLRGMTMRVVSWRGNRIRVLARTRLEPAK